MFETFKQFSKDTYLALNVCGIFLFPTPLIFIFFCDYFSFLSQRMRDSRIRVIGDFGYLLRDTVSILEKRAELAFVIGGIGLLMIVATWSLMVHRDYIKRRSMEPTSRPTQI